MAVLRRASKARRLEESSPKSSLEDALADCQIEDLVAQKAMDFYDQKPEAKELLDLLDQDRQSILSKEDILKLSNSYEKLLRRVAGQ